jgi:outer membrane protein assembly factor BamB
LEKDGSVQSFDAQSGRSVWSARLSSTPYWLGQLNDRLLVVDRSASTSYLAIIDPASGVVLQQVSPECTADPNSLSDSFETDASITPDPIDGSIYLMYGTFSACVQRWEASSGKMTWQTALKDASFTLADNLHPLLVGDKLYLNGDHNLQVVDKRSGAANELISNPDYDFVPLAIQDNVLIVRAKRTRGTTRFELWAVDAASGQSLWQLPFPNDTEPLDEPDRMSGLIDSTSSGFTAHLTSRGLVVMVASADPHQLLLKTLNPQSGASTALKAIPVNATGDFYSVPDVIGWTDTSAWIVLDGNLYVVDLVNGTITYQW